MKRVFVYCFIVGMLATGNLGTIVTKAMNDEKLQGDYFQHPYFKTASMFIGEVLAWLLTKLLLTSVLK